MADDRLFVCASRYTRPSDEVDAQRDAHLAWIASHYAAGRMLASGRQDPPVGGLLVLRAESREAVEALLRTDPYVRHELVSYAVTAFTQTPAPLRSRQVADFLAS
ncbi:MAG TPA: YciI family protein [Capillimicrobium sp.]|jgi:uncharacterized protein YciI